jgi:perosamine synthetase
MTRILQIEPVLGAEEREEVLNVMNSGFITEGRKTRELEYELAKYFGVPFALVVNNATVALTIALQGLGIGQGDEVIVPDFTFIATANAVSLCGATPIFADVSRETFTLNLSDVEQRITPRTKGIVPVHLNGRPCDMSRLAKLSDEYGLALVEDAAQAMGSAHDGRFLGTLCDAGVFSLGTTKIITAGQGGILLTRRKELYESFVRIKDHGRRARASEIHDVVGFNSKFTDLQAALALAQFRKLPERIEKKRDLFRWYREYLAAVAEVSIPTMYLSENVPWFVDILCEDRAGLISYLAAAGIETRCFYLPIHTQPCYRTTGNYPATEEISARGLWLPSSVNLAKADVENICAHIAAYYSAGESRKISIGASAQSR